MAEIRIESSWHEVLNEEFEKAYFSRLKNFLKEEKASRKIIYPPDDKIFAAMNACPFSKVKVVVLGQDPYHGSGQANGLCFSVNPRVDLPPSLKNIFKEMEVDLGISPILNGDLSHLAKQGVLLLNATLTVQAGMAGSHQNKGWEAFTDVIVQKLNAERENLVFMLWGGYAKKKGSIINRSRHFVLESGHPSPLSANKGHWFGNKHFSKANAYLDEKGLTPISWV